MKILKISLLATTIGLLFLAFSPSAERPDEGIPTGVYTTYEDYAAGKIDPMDEIKNFSYGFGTTVDFYKGKTKHAVKCKDMWGFKYKNTLFRIEPIQREPEAVVSLGKIVYYENGLAYLNALMDNTSSGSSPAGGTMSFLSKNLSSEMTPLPTPGVIDPANHYGKFKKANKAFTSLYKCLDGCKGRYLEMRKCAENYNKNAARLAKENEASSDTTKAKEEPADSATTK